MAKEKEKVPWKTAFETADQPYRREVPLLKVDEEGTPQRIIETDLEAKDQQTHWQMHLPALWFIVAICCLYFFYILVVYG